MICRICSYAVNITIVVDRNDVDVSELDNV